MSLVIFSASTFTITSGLLDSGENATNASSRSNKENDRIIVIKLAKIEPLLVLSLTLTRGLSFVLSKWRLTEQVFKFEILPAFLQKTAFTLCATLPMYPLYRLK